VNVCNTIFYVVQSDLFDIHSTKQFWKTWKMDIYGPGKL